MRLSSGFLAALADSQADDFDNEIADILVRNHARASDWRREECLAWVRRKRGWLERHGIVAQQHILDHLEIMIVNGDGVIDDPDYRAIMMRPFLSREEKALALRRRFLTGRDERGQSERV
ncbi:hypothetical protein PE067_16630 [Paracoccus sp. DMF-8]|uniref:hypothetical protein n=1 Tax=Paracoccus sp. DMF-8 TaxID=3019445 RepID=UPI0023E42766|nr:hypothetical protein [Paracoccus sp. DMF-8]MDF3607629.1 hypothetical protein [Paracoccus sp. DMF-8]